MRVTYRMADGSLVAGEFGWVADPDYFDDVDEPVEVIRETWSLVETEVIRLPKRLVEIEEELAKEADADP